MNSQLLRLTARWLALASMMMGARTFAGGVPGVELGVDLAEVIVTASRVALLGQATAASQGTVLAAQLANRPTLRTGEILEVIPGLVVTQHSGAGKANQYFLRGFNLDHGTDFATRVEGMPVNMRTHAHGQGYSDINFLIPELVEKIEYKKGTYFADEGDFSAAGAADITYVSALEQSLLSLSGGEHAYQRALLATSFKRHDNEVLLAADYSHNDGPWDLPEGFRKLNGLLKVTHGDRKAGFDVTAMGYDGRWRSTDQIPLRAVQAGSLSRFGAIDPTDGGSTHRYSLSANWWQPAGKGQLRASAYGIDSCLNLISNFTYFLDSVDGDQFEQFEQRRVYGGELRYRLPVTLGTVQHALQSGMQVRYDRLRPVGLYRTRQRARIATIRQDEVDQVSYSAFVSDGIRWTNFFRSELGLRVDRFRFEVHSNLAANSGVATDSVVSPKLSLTFGPWAHTEYFLNYGEGFHSNDARGATIKVDPVDGATPVGKVEPLVKARGAEFGLRSAIVPRVQLAASVWTLKLDSELLFVGDGGATEASRASRRSGIELSAYYTPTAWLTVDADLALSRSRFIDDDIAGKHIPGAVARVASVGVAVNRRSGWFGGARWRYLGSGALIEDNSVRSTATSLLNLEAGYHLTRNIKASAQLLNALDKQANDITYFYESRLPGEAEPVADIHFHPVEPRTLRGSVTVSF